MVGAGLLDAGIAVDDDLAAAIDPREAIYRTVTATGATRSGTNLIRSRLSASG
jgi:hypothetical protein